MSEALYPYYERELLFIRQMSQEFAKQYPAAAGRLLLEPNRSTDPHVERLIEAFALLSARIHHKIDDEFPELTDALLGVLYPHYLAPVPSMAILQFELNASRAELPDGFLIDKGSQLHTQPVDGVPCKFRTCYPVTLWPVGVTSLKLQPPPFPGGIRAPAKTAAILRIGLECQANLTFSQLSLDKLRFYLNADMQIVPVLYELLFNHATQVWFRPLDKGPEQPPLVFKPEECLGQVGFELDENLLPYPNRSFLGYRLLTEFFTFPGKFQFLDLKGFPRAAKADFQRRMEVVIFLNRTMPSLEQGLDAHSFRLGCTPVINLFDQTAEPIPLTQARYEYRVLPDVAHPHGLEVYSIDSVVSAEPGSSVTREYHPFYSFRHGNARETERTFWYASRRPATREGDRGTDVTLNLVDLDFNPKLPAEQVLVLQLTCTNRNLPAKLQLAGESLYFELEAAAPITGIRCLRTPTFPHRPAMRRGAYWRLISHLSLNHLSITDPVEGRDALQEILRLYDFTDPEVAGQLSAVNNLLIEGISAVTSRRVVGRTGTEISSGFSRGVEVTIEFDEQKYVGSWLFAFACVLERFLGMQASLNSFSQLVARTKQREGIIKKWPPRAGALQLL